MNVSQLTSSRPDSFFNNSFFSYRAGLHVLFWSCYLIYEGLIWGMVDGEYAQRLTSTSVELPVKLAATYFTLYILIDRLLLQRRYILFLIWLVTSMIGFGILLRAVAYYTLYPVFYPQGTEVPLLYFPKILIAIFSIYSVAGTVAAFHVIMHWYKHQQASQQLEKEKLESELKILKSQINPHFLFNTLNSLYVLTLNQSKNAPEIVHKLSELMSYMLYDSNLHEVPLKNELHYIANYIALEKIRYESKVDISFNTYSNVDGFKIAPLIILPFVENCFKHGVQNQVSNSWIRIDISINNSLMTLKIENSKGIDNIGVVKTASGIGLQNVKKRLELIYENRYDLQLIDDAESFLVILRLQLDREKIIQKKAIEEIEAT